MKKQRFTEKRPVGSKSVKFFLLPNGGKGAMVPAFKKDPDVYYTWDHLGEYKGVSDKPFRGMDNAKEITKESFLG